MASDLSRVRATGTYFPAGSSDPRPAVMEADTDGAIRILDPEGVGILAARRGDIEISARVANIPRRIRFGDSSLFVTPENDAIDRLDNTRGARRGAFVHKLERFRLRLAVFVVLVALLATAIYRYALPTMVEVAVAATPQVVPELLSSGVVESLDRFMLSESTLEESRRQEIAESFGMLAARSEAGPDSFDLMFRDGGLIGPNAFALPDGTIILTDQLVRIASEDEMILGVLAHEIGHVERQHSLRQIYRLAGMSGLIMLIAGDVGDAVEEVLVDATALLSLSHSREHEREADRHSVELMLKAGLDPLALNRFFRLLGEELGMSDESGFLSSHPATRERVEALEAYARELGADVPNAR